MLMRHTEHVAARFVPAAGESGLSTKLEEFKAPRESKPVGTPTTPKLDTTPKAAPEHPIQPQRSSNREGEDKTTSKSTYDIAPTS